MTKSLLGEDQELRRAGWKPLKYPSLPPFGAALLCRFLVRRRSLHLIKSAKRLLSMQYLMAVFANKRDYNQARSTYSDVSVLTMIASPGATKGGTDIRTPLSSSAGL